MWYQVFKPETVGCNFLSQFLAFIYVSEPNALEILPALGLLYVVFLHQNQGVL